MLFCLFCSSHLSLFPHCVELAQESLAAVVLVLEDHVVLPDVVFVGYGHIGGHVTDPINRGPWLVSDGVLSTDLSRGMLSKSPISISLSSLLFLAATSVDLPHLAK